MPPLPNAWRVEVFKRPGRADPEGAEALGEAHDLGFEGIRSVRHGRGYLFSPELSRSAVEAIAAELLADPVLEEAAITPPGEAPRGPSRGRVLVARKPGVMDPVALSVQAALGRDGLVSGAPPRVQSFTSWEIDGALAKSDLERLGRRLFANEVVDELLVESETLAFASPAGEPPPEPDAVRLAGAGEDQLLRISAEGVLSLDLAEMRAIQAHFEELGRDPTPAELETLAQTWSEHCKHKTLTGRIRFGQRRIDNLLKHTIMQATRELDREWCVSVFHDNAGIVAFEGDWDLCFKVETHNHPSAIDPYGGAGTGIGGVIRDVLGCGLGALPIASTDCFFVGPMDVAEEDLPEGTLHPRRILRGVVRGVADYGNRMGIPTVSGGVWFHPRYVANPLVYAGTLGLMPRSAATKSVEPGDVIVLVGGRTGRDGIHGATFSSAELSDRSAVVSSAAVQIGDPIQERKVLDALLEARDRGLYRGITDCGAGGLSSAVGEMGESTGARVELEKVPLKYPGLTPSEIWISEAQERMVLAVPPGKVEALLSVFASEDCEATPIGHFTGTGRLELSYEGRRVCDLDMGFLHGGAPRPELVARWDPPERPDPGCPVPDDLGAAILSLVAHPDCQSREWIVRRYDHEVGGASVLKPLVGPHSDGPGDAAVLAPLADSTRGVALAVGANPRQGRLDPGAMAAAAIDEALSNVVAVGGDPARTALLDNFSWGDVSDPEELGALVLACEACREAARAYGTPFISGKDSLNNTYNAGGRRVSIPPTLLISALAVVPDVRRAVTMDLKAPGHSVYLVGETRAELGGSTWLETCGLDGGRVPRPDLERAPKILASLHRALAAGEACAAHDLAEGGLAVAAAEMALAGRLGLEIDLERVPVRDAPGADPAQREALALFSESRTRFLVEVAPEHERGFAAALEGHPAVPVGRTLGEPCLRIVAGGAPRCQISLDALVRAHAGEVRP